jgi:hypothetical protein
LQPPEVQHFKSPSHWSGLLAAQLSHWPVNLLHWSRAQQWKVVVLPGAALGISHFSWLAEHCPDLVEKVQPKPQPMGEPCEQVP